MTDVETLRYALDGCAGYGRLSIMPWASKSRAVIVRLYSIETLFTHEDVGADELGEATDKAPHKASPPWSALLQP